MIERIETVENATNETLEVLLEPWGMPHRLVAGHSLRVVARSSHDGQLEVIRSGNLLTIYAWHGATAQVFEGDMLVHDLPTPVPNVPAKMSIRAFVNAMFRSRKDRK